MSASAQNQAESSEVGISSTMEGYVITPNTDEFGDHPDVIEFQGTKSDWKEFQRELSSRDLDKPVNPPLGLGDRPFSMTSSVNLREDFYAIPTLHPELDSLSSFKDLLQIEADYQKALEDTINSDGFGNTLSKVSDTAERVKESPHNHIENWKDLLKENGKRVHKFPLEFDQKAKLFHKTTDKIPVNNSHKREKLDSFSQTLNGLDNQERDQLFCYLETPNHELADTLFNISQGRYADFVEDEVEQIRELLPSDDDIQNQELPDIPGVFEENSPYRETVDEIYEELETDLLEVSYLADLRGEIFEPDLSVLKKWEAERQGRWDAGLDEEEHQEKAEKLGKDAKREIQKQVSNLQREYVKKEMESLGSENVENLYEEITGERKSIDELEKNDDLIYALRLRKDVSRGIENLEEIIRNQDNPNRVYLLEEGEESNKDWLDSKEYGLEELTNPNLEEHLEDSGFESSDRTESAFTTYVEELDEELTYRIADPLESLGMGKFADSCRAIGETRPRAAVHDAIAPNRLTIYVEDKEQKRKARVKAAITEDDKLVYRRKSGQNDMGVDLEGETEEYLNAVATNLGLDLEYNEENDEVKDRVKLLSSEDFYWD